MKGLVQSKLIEWIIYLAMFAAALYLMIMFLPALVGGSAFSNPGLIK